MLYFTDTSKKTESYSSIDQDIPVPDSEPLNNSTIPSRNEELELHRLRDEVRQQHAHLNVLQRPSILVLSSIIMLYAFAEMAFITPMISLTMSKICQGIIEENFGPGGDGICDMKQVQTTASEITSITMILNGVISLLISGKIGQLSDRVGRIPIFAFIGLMKVIGNSVNTFAVSSHVHYSKWLIIFSSTIPSLNGGMFALMANIISYVTDVIEPEDRTENISTILSIMHGTMGVAPLISSIVIKTHKGNEMVSVYVSIMAVSIFTLLCIFVFKEPRHTKVMETSEDTYRKRQTALLDGHSIRLSQSNGSIHIIKNYIHFQFVQLLELFTPVREIWLARASNGLSIARYNVLIIVTIDLLTMTATVAIMPALILMTTYKYSWKSVELGYFISFSGLCNAFVLSLVAPRIFRYLKEKYAAVTHSVDKVDIISLRIAISSITFGLFILLTNSSHFESVLIFTIFRSIGAITGPTLQSATVKYYGTNTGQVLGGIALLHSFCMLIMPALMLSIYGMNISTKPQNFIYIPLLACIISLILTFFLRIVYISDNQGKDPEAVSTSEATLDTGIDL